MRKMWVGLVLTLSWTLVAAAAAASAENPPLHRGRHYGAPVVKYTVLRDQGVMMFGGRGAFGLTPSLMLGGGLHGTLTEVDARSGVVPNAPGPLDLKVETGTVDLEYAPRAAGRTHLTFTAQAGFAALHLTRNGTTDQFGETDFLWLVEPDVGVERSVSGWCHLSLSAAYRLVGGVEQAGLKNADIDGAVLSLAVKFGRF